MAELKRSRIGEQIYYYGTDAEIHDLPEEAIQGSIFVNLTHGTRYIRHNDTKWYLVENPLSASTPVVAYIRLATPTISIDKQGTVTWSAVTNAASYLAIITTDGVDASPAPATSGSINLEGGQTVRVSAVGATAYLSSKYCDQLTYVVPLINYITTFGTQPAVKSNEGTTLLEASLPTLTQNGYTFGGWYLEPTLENEATTSTDVTGNMTLYAKWTKNTYTVTYNLDSGANHPSNPATFTVDSATITLSNATKDGYTFSGWFTEAAGAGTKVTSIASGSHSNVVLYAYFVAINYTITYNLYGSTNHLDNPATYDVETTTITLGNPTKTGYTSNGWYDNADFEGSAVTEITLGSTGNVVLYAKFTAIEYTLAYDFGVLTEVTNPNEAVTFTLDDLPMALSAASKENYVFGGWFGENTYENAITSLTAENYAALLAVDTITLYGKFTYSVAVAFSELQAGTSTNLVDVAEVLTLTTTFPETINAVLDDVYTLDYKLDFSKILEGILGLGVVSITSITYGGSALTLDTTAEDLLENPVMYLSEYVTDFTRPSVVDSQDTTSALVIEIGNTSGQTLAGDVEIRVVVSNDDFATETVLAVDTEAVSIVDEA